jgi:LysR family nitrogen assimilation transcriptional regulator
MDIRNLEIFVEVARLGGFNRAAAQLHIAQSALSRRVANLEHEIGVDLLVRSKRGVKLTPAGTVLLAKARTLLADFEQVKNEILSEAGEPRGSVSIGFPPSLIGEASELLQLLHQRFPTLFIRSWVATTVDLNAMLLDGRIDLGIFAAIESDPVLETYPLFADGLYLYAAAGRIEGRRTTWANIADVPLILPSQPNAVRRMIDAGEAKRGRRIEVAMEVNDIALIMRLVAEGAGYTILPCSALRTVDSALYSYAEVPGVKIEWVAACLRDRPYSAAVTRIFEMLRERTRA